jgi:peptidoglycan/LPS O-acetylase OafA/YrhL
MLPVVAVGDPSLLDYPFSPSAWSLVLEFWFNLLFAVTAVRWGIRGLSVIAGAAFLVLCHQAVQGGTTDLGWGVSTLVGGSARFWFSFTLGVILFRLRKAGPSLPPVYLLLVSPALLFILIPGNNIVLQLVWIGVVFPLFVHIAARINVSGAAAVVSDHLGRLSYGIYILHGPVMMLMLGALTVVMGRVWEQHALATSAFLFVGVMVATAVLTYWFDEPFRRWIRNKRRAAKA